MHGISEIRTMNKAAAGAKRDVDFRVQRDKLMQAVKRLLAKDMGAEAFAQKVLAEIT